MGPSQMSSATRQATPGPSSSLPESRDCSLSTSKAKKRVGSEDIEDPRHNKKNKVKVDAEPLSNLSMNAKDKKKKKKKKKKRTSVVVPDVETKGRVRSNSRTLSNKPASVGKKETVTNGLVDDTKRTFHKEEPLLKLLNKGKGKARSNSPTSQVPTTAFCSEIAEMTGSGDLNMIPPDSTDHASEIARLKKQLASQDILLQKHKVYLTQHQQALTCQICLDLMYKPFALAPCGHITCYNCLIRWFTALQNPNAAAVANDNANPLLENVDEVQLIVNSAEARQGTYLRRRKTCPVCRAAVLQRPVEMWGIKAMVATLVNSELMDLPVPIALPNSTTPGSANNNGDANNDPWRYIFQRTIPLNNARQGPLMHGQVPDHEHMGVHDYEDGGVYRCIECLHEIWGGVCSGCNRRYPGHGTDDDDLDDDDDSVLDGVNYLFRHEPHHFVHDGELDEDEDDEDDEDGYDQFWGEGDNHLPVNLHHPVYPMHDYIFLSGDEAMTDSEGEGDNLQDLNIFDSFHPAYIGPPALGGIARIDEGSDEERESNYGGSFIDDNEEEEGEDLDDEEDVIELDASSDEESTRPRRQPQSRIQQRQRPQVISEGEESEDEENIVDLDDDEDDDLPARPRHAAVVLTDDSRSSGEESDDNEEALAEEEAEVLPRLRARPRARVLSDDE